MQHHRHQHGFMLIEVLVSILIFTVAVLGLIALLASSSQVSVDGENRERAALLASIMASEMWDTKTVNIPAADISAWQHNLSTSTNPQYGLPAASGNVSVSGANIAFISLQWTPPQGTLHTYQTIVQIP